MLADTDGVQLPIDPARDLWKLLAASGGNRFDVFGEWNGLTLTPVTAFADGRLIELN